MLRPFAHPVGCCWMLLRVVAQSLKPVKLFSQRLSTFLFFRDRRNVAQQCWIRLDNSSNIVGATHAHYACFTKTHGLYPSHDALQVPTLLGVVASVCTPLPTCTQQLPTLLAQQCWELLRPFARSLRTKASVLLESHNDLVCFFTILFFLSYKGLGLGIFNALGLYKLLNYKMVKETFFFEKTNRKSYPHVHSDLFFMLEKFKSSRRI